MKTLKILVVAAALVLAACASAAPPATCIVSGTVVDGGAVAVPNTPVRFRTIAPTLSGTSGIATQDLTTKTAADGTWSLTLVQGLNAQVDIPAVGIYADTVIPSGVLCPAAFTSLTLSARGALTPATIISTTGPSMGGDLTGSSPNPSVVGLRGKGLHADTATDGKVWVYRTASGDYRLESFPVSSAVQTVTAGQGIVVTGTSTNPVVAVPNGGIVGAMLAVGTVESAVGTLSGDLTGTLPSPQIGSGVIVDADVNNTAAIGWAKISKAGAVAADVGAIGGSTVIAAINASVETPKIAAAQLAGGIAESQVTGLVSDLAAKRNTADAIPQADVTGLVAALAAKEATANKGAVSGYAGLDSGGKVPAAQLPSTVLADGDKGDITVSAGGTAFAIDPNAVTYSKLQAVSAPDRVLGAILAGTAVEIPFTAAARALSDDADAPAMRSTLGLGTASVLNVAAAGDAAVGEVVKGSDTRLADARTPVTHTHVESQVTGLVTDLAAKVDDSTVITTTAPLTIDGGASADLSAARTFAVSGATTGARGSVRLAGDLAGTADSPSVASVGGQSAANVASGVALALAATDAATPLTIVKRTAGGAATLDVVGNVTGNASGTAANITGVAAVANGGTGQATATAGFDALSPTSAKGDLIGHDGATSVRVAVGVDGQILTADAASPAGVKWSAVAGTGTVTSVGTGNGLQGGPITTTGTVDLRLNASGGLSKILGAGFNELGIATGGVADAMLATPAVPQARTITTTAPLTIGGGASADLSANRTLAVNNATAGAVGVIQLAGDIGNTATAPSVVTVGGQTAANVAAGAVLANAATAVNTASAIVRRDASGNFAGGTFTGNVTGNVTGNSTGTHTGGVNGGTVAGTIRDEGGAVYDVKAYGATGDGSTDDSAAFAAAKAAMGATGAVLYCPPGSYKIGAFALSLVGMTLRGAGAGATTILTTVTGGTGLTLSAANTTVEGVTIAISGAPAGAQLSLLLSGVDSLARDIVLTGFLSGFRTTGLRAAVENIVCLSPASGALSVGKIDGDANRIERFKIGTVAAPLTVTDGLSFTVPTTGIRVSDGDIYVTSATLTRGLYFNASGSALADAMFTNVRSIAAGADVNFSVFFQEPTTGVRFVGCELTGVYGGVKVNAVSVQELRFDNSIIGGASGAGAASLELAYGSTYLNNTSIIGGSASKVVLDEATGSLFWFGGRLGPGGPAAIDNTAGADVRLYGVTVDDPTGYTNNVFLGPCVTGGTVASATSLSLLHRVTIVTGVAEIQSIDFPNGSEPITLIPDGAFTFGTAGNIARALKATVGVPITLYWRESDLKWYPTESLSPLTSDGTDVTVAGPLMSQRKVTAVTTTASPAATASATLYHNEGDVDGSSITLPAAAAGLTFSFVVETAQLQTINATAGDTIRIESVFATSGGYIRSNVPGSYVTLVALNGSEWVATAWGGEWTNGTWWSLSTHAEGAIYWATPAATSNAAATPIKCAGTTAAQGTAVRVTQATTNRLTYTGVPTRDFKVEATVGISAAAATTAKLHLYKNGSLITGATITRVITSTDIGAMAIHAFVSLATNDYVELWCETDDGDDLTIQNGVLSLASIN